ncbi:MAG: hypothetical protein HOC91_14790 [Nitrospinaceae bacterium]|jgi:hypothetical protein|nr:hypothetical protein [Nitrospinaceae bacterium]MBT3434915.1 hypothetical protein [Nitrospinaceae bacterium]MBT4431774.1 hypothetical protein [Nitrospinaceae bacterium]MBT5368305.1 hypothetical protein [Nitrospinaceae bacterium]MBT5947669.1 hypothetical protein [Nitrospinaceae bacterium]
MFTACLTYCRGLKLLQALAAVALIFGAASVFSGGQVLFGPEKMRLAAGNYVPAVVWFNFFAGFAYMVAAIGLFRHAEWGAHLALAIAVATVMTFAALAVYIFTGGAFEARTIGAMTLRTGLWGVIACVARQGILRKK